MPTPNHTPRPLDDALPLPTEGPDHPSPDDFREHGAALIDLLIEYERTLSDRPIVPPTRPGDVLAELPAGPPETGEPFAEVLRDVERIVLPNLTHWQHPGFLAFFPANSSYPAILADLLCTGLAVQGMLWQTSPACTELETRMLDWMAGMIGLPGAFSTAGGGGGVIHGTASEATLCAMVAARDAALRARSSRTIADLRVYTSSQAHSSVLKAAGICGIGRDNVRLIDVDEDLAMDPAALAEAMQRDRDDGLVPCFVAATLGTTSSGAIDPLGPIADAMTRDAEAGGGGADDGPWLHVDAAWAGSALVCPEYRGMLDEERNGIGRVDSFCFNPHKWLLTNFDCSCFWVAGERRRHDLLRALSITPEYLKTSENQSVEGIDYRDWQIPLGRRFRALKLWFVIRHYGVQGLRAHIRRHVRAAEALERVIRADDRLTILVPRSLSLLCVSVRDDDALTRAFHERANATGRVYLTHTVIPDRREATGVGLERSVVRLSVGGSRQGLPEIRAAWEVLVGVLDEMDMPGR